MAYKHIIMLLLLVPTAQAVVIQELYADPSGTETGGEAVLLYNDADVSVDVSGWMLDTPSSTPDATLPQNTTMQPHGVFLIADTGWSTAKDNTSWSDAHLEEAITLRNTGGIGSLRDANGTLVDSGTYSATTEGTAYWRQGAEVVPTEPLFELFDALYLLESATDVDNGTATTIEVTDNGVPISTITPIPGGTKYISVTTTSTVEPRVTFLGIEQVMEPLGNDRYTADLPINYTTTPGNHDITVVGDATSVRTLAVLPLLAVQSDATTLQAQRTSPGTFTIAGDASYGTSGLTLRNAGNVDVDVHLSRTAVLRDGTRANVVMRAVADAEEIAVTSRSTYLTILRPGQTAPLSITIDVSGADPGSYTTSLALQLKKT